MTNSEATTQTTQAPSPSLRTVETLALDLRDAALRDLYRDAPDFVVDQLRDALSLACRILLRDPASRDWLYANIASNVTRQYMDSDAKAAQR